LSQKHSLILINYRQRQVIYDQYNVIKVDVDTGMCHKKVDIYNHTMYAFAICSIANERIFV